ncbi:DHS-like NAD/FAD-binding domain-containing protein [Cercophora scortea]|uniref:protein acetyllysine N-acetyltransferase n=1 Tax=Cercophora scortea TaxID=314031 RepID=A0AAE0IDP1_9PEZI|nr:DHS-like NAD/FAD-binding domain-containing protein [Cercophora scortea]
MASSAPKIALEEHFDAPEEVDRKAQILADRIRTSAHFIVFTGAGVSTSAGIPDFRGPDGVWTRRAQGKEVDSSKLTSTLQAVPTATHMALVELQNRGVLKHLVSQNCDGLHRRSGVLPSMLSELHGNSNLEHCRDCKTEYLRGTLSPLSRPLLNSRVASAQLNNTTDSGNPGADFRAVAPYTKTVHDHYTKRKCALCSGPLLDSIINFHEPLPASTLARAFAEAEKADLCLVLGSSLTVTPANEIPETAARNTKRGPGRKTGSLAICNLQSTPLDELVKPDLRVYASADDLMTRVMAKLGMEIPRFVLRRRVAVEERVNGTDGNSKWEVAVLGFDGDTPATFLKTVRLGYNRRVVREEPFVFAVQRGGGRADVGTVLKFELEFMGHYGEPGVEVEFIVGEEGEERAERVTYLLEFDLGVGGWAVTRE